MRYRALEYGVTSHSARAGHQCKRC